MSLYGCLLWSLSPKSIHLIEVALNKILRKVWNLPSRSHTNIVHSVAHLPDVVFKCFSTFFNRGVVYIYILCHFTDLSQSSLLAYIFTGYKFMYGSHHLKNYSDLDWKISTSIRQVFGSFSPFENLIVHWSCL